MKCSKCHSNDWDHANVGLIGAIVCTDCGEIYMMKDEKIIDDVLEQIVLDVKQGDLTAIEEMIKRLPYDVLVGFISCAGLPEGT